MEELIVNAFMLGLVLGVVLGTAAAIMNGCGHRKSAGTLKALTDPVDGETYLFLELNDDADIFSESRQICIDVDIPAHHSQG